MQVERMGKKVGGLESHKPQDIIDKLMGKVEYVGDCWEWTGGKNNKGYGVTNYGGKRWYAHRLAYSLLKGDIPVGLVLDHLCRNTVCVNPDHLEVVTLKENILRGFGWAGLNAKKETCPLGHQYTFLKNSQRTCAICSKAWVWKNRDRLNRMRRKRETPNKTRIGFENRSS